MKSQAIRKLSVIGLILSVASGVAAAVYNTNKTGASFHGNDNGSLRENTSEGLTCITNDNGGMPECTKTAMSSNFSTTGMVAAESLEVDSQTVGNTSYTFMIPGDQTSITEPPF